jgi:hypothetical protein
VKPEPFVTRFGARMPPREFGEKIVSVLDDPTYAEGLAFGLKGDTRITMLEAESGFSTGRFSLNSDRRATPLALAGGLRPDLHRYCARLMGSVIDGEGVEQDTLVRAFVALQDQGRRPRKSLRPRSSRRQKSCFRPKA